MSLTCPDLPKRDGYQGQNRLPAIRRVSPLPKMKKNFISIQCLTRDMDCNFILNKSDFVVKDEKKGKIILSDSSAKELCHMRPGFKVTRTES